MAELESMGEQADTLPRHQQIPLAVQLRDDATFSNFLALPREEPLVRALHKQMASDGEAIIYLYGPEGSGKTHLLQACCHESAEGAVYLPLAQLREFPAEEVLQGVERLGRVCIDDIHLVMGDADWETALFNFYNNARLHGCRLVVAGDASPRALAVKLADLRSRLSWGIVYQLDPGSDTEKSAILQFRAQRRGLTLSASVAAYIVSRAPRAMDQLLLVLDVLDNASLTQQRALTIPFVRETLRW
ncbi:MAG: DnaA regulatory inactivator Hda [Halioglobus sp.]